MPTRVIHKTLDECVAPRQTMEHGLFLTRKIIGSQQLSACDPFILADHVGPIQYGAGEALGVPDHPHRGLVVVTYVVEGGMRHQDSLGHNDELLAGSVQWLTTGRGLVHRELPNDQLLADGGTWEGFQLWINLPKKDKMVCPEMQEVRPEDVPQFCDQLGRFSVKVLIGQYKDVRSPIRTHTPVTLLDVRVTAASSFSLELPDGHTCWLYVWRGAGTLGHGEQRPVRAGHVARLSDDGHAFQATAGREDDMRLLIGSGVPLKESIFKFGTFVMSSVSEIEQALEDYRSGRLGRITVGASRDGGGSVAARGLDLMNPFQGEIERIGAEPEAVAEEGGAAAPSPADSESTAARLTNGHRHF